MPLPLLLDHIIGETPASFLARLAMRNGVNATELAADLGWSIKSFVDGSLDAIAQLALYGNACPDALAAASFHKLGIRKYIRNGLPLPRQAVKSPEVRACVACLREDARRAGKLTQIGMAMRADWQLPFLRTCSIHNLPLITLWANRNATTRHDFTTLVGLKLCPITTRQLDPEPRQYSDFEDWVVRRINAGDHQYWFDQHDFYAAASFCELLGRAVMLNWVQKSARMTEDNWHEAGKIGFDVCQRGEEFVRGMLDAIQRRGGSPQDGPNARFGSLHDRFSRDMNGPEFEPFRTILREHILNTWPLGPGDQVLGVPVGIRRLHSVRTASNETGMGTVRLRKALAAAGLVASADKNTSDAWDVFDAAIAAPILAQMTSSMGASEAHEHFNFPRDQFEIMQDEGYFSPIATGENTYPAYNPKDIQDFLNILLTRAVRMRQAPQGCCDIPSASRRLNCSSRDIVRLLHAGQLKRIGLHSERPGYLGIIVDLKELRPLIQKDDVIGRTLAQVGEEVGIRLPQVRALVDAGLLTAVLGRNPIKKVPQLYVTDADFADFNNDYVGVKNIALDLGVSTVAALRTLNAVKVHSIGGANRQYGPIYRRDLIVKHFLAAWPRNPGRIESVAFLWRD